MIIAFIMTIHVSVITDCIAIRDHSAQYASLSYEEAAEPFSVDFVFNYLVMSTYYVHVYKLIYHCTVECISGAGFMNRRSSRKLTYRL